MMDYTKGKWSVGNGTVICDTVPDDMKNTSTGHNMVEFYGGYLVAESIAREADKKLISASPDMFEALNDLENDAGQIPKHKWDKVQAALKKAGKK